MFSSLSYGDAIPVSDSTGFTNVVDLFGQTSPYTDPDGNTASVLSGSFRIAFNSDSLTVTFAQPVTRAGVTLGVPVAVAIGSFQLSNGDSTPASDCVRPSGFMCFVGVIDSTPFTSFTLDVASVPNQVFSAVDILDFRYTPASAAVPETGTATLLAPLLIAGLAAFIREIHLSLKALKVALFSSSSEPA